MQNKLAAEVTDFLKETLKLHGKMKEAKEAKMKEAKEAASSESPTVKEWLAKYNAYTSSGPKGSWEEVKARGRRRRQVH